MSHQYRDRHRDDDQWLFRQFVSCLTDGQLWNLRSWNLERREDPATARDAVAKLEVIEEEVERRPVLRIDRG